MIPFNYHHLYYFYMTAKEGSVLQAAKALHLSQPALSAQIKQFENYLEKKLFDRGTRRLTLTAEGHRIMVYAQKIFDLGQEMMDHLGDTRQEDRLRLQIGVSQNVPRSLVTEVIQQLIRENSRFVLQVCALNFDSILAGLTDHSLDLALCEDAPSLVLGDTIDRYRLADIPVVLSTHRDFFKNIRRFPKDLEKYPWILPTPGREIRRQLQEYLDRAGIRPQIYCEVDDSEIMRRLVLQKKGLAPLSQFSLQKAPGSEKIQALSVRPKLSWSEPVYLLRRKRIQPHPGAEILIKIFSKLTASQASGSQL